MKEFAPSGSKFFTFKSSAYFGSGTRENFQEMSLVCVKLIAFWLRFW